MMSKYGGTGTMNGNSNNRRNGNGRNGRDHTTGFPPGGGSASDQIKPAMWADMTNMIFHRFTPGQQDALCQLMRDIIDVHDANSNDDMPPRGSTGNRNLLSGYGQTVSTFAKTDESWRDNPNAPPAGNWGRTNMGLSGDRRRPSGEGGVHLNPHRMRCWRITGAETARRFLAKMAPSGAHPIFGERALLIGHPVMLREAIEALNTEQAYRDELSAAPERAAAERHGVQDRLDEAEAAVKRWQRDDVGHTVYLYLNGLDTSANGLADAKEDLVKTGPP